MSELTEYFNKSSVLTTETSIDIDEKRLADPDKIDLWHGFQGILATARNKLKQDLQKEFPAAVAFWANQGWSEPSHTLPPRPTPRPIMTEEVTVMLVRAKENDTTLDKLVPHSDREERIQYGYDLADKDMKQQIAKREVEDLEIARHHLDNLLTLPMDELLNRNDLQFKNMLPSEPDWSRKGALTEEYGRVR